MLTLKLHERRSSKEVARKEVSEVQFMTIACPIFGSIFKQTVFLKWNRLNRVQCSYMAGGLSMTSVGVRFGSHVVMFWESGVGVKMWELGVGVRFGSRAVGVRCGSQVWESCVGVRFGSHAVGVRCGI